MILNLEEDAFTLTAENIQDRIYIYHFCITADNELKKAVMKAKNGTTMTYSLTKFTSNPTVDDSKFVYDAKKYPGYNLIKD